MKITVDARNPGEAGADLLALPVARFEKRATKLPSALASADRATRGQLRAAIASGDFQGKPDQSLLLYPDRRLRAKRVLLLGVGDTAKLDSDALRSLAGRCVREAARRRAGRVALMAPDAKDAVGAVQALAEGALLAGYRFGDYRKNGGDDAPGRVAALSLLVARGAAVADARRAAQVGIAIAESQNLARRLSDLPANALPPEALAAEVRRVGRELGLKVRVLDVPAMKKLGMGGILAVGGGSANPPRLIALEYQPKGKKSRGARKPVALVGKGITFDSGGISIKPSAGMDEMKHDMSGAAAVIGTLRAAALLELETPVVGVIGAAENMPSATAYRPGDVVTTMAGKTIEVLNTDAEGRVVLADALHYARTTWKPDAIVDLATLTGAMVVALGHNVTGLFGNNAKLIELVRAAGDATGERAWPMPLLDSHKEDIRSEIAEIKNTGGRPAGSSTAAAFLWHFVGDTPWVHLDIAGTAWTNKAGPIQRKGATGVGVRLLVELLRHWDPAGLRG
ncbi:MAG TPA: leucyl aminopeptidase [Myxococcota bacterium]|nr:leucyl aminopeptidase [Myxococcota bacterium]